MYLPRHSNTCKFLSGRKLYLRHYTFACLWVFRKEIVPESSTRHWALEVLSQSLTGFFFVLVNIELLCGIVATGYGMLLSDCMVGLKGLEMVSEWAGKEIRISESKKLLLVQSGNQKEFACGIRNTAQGIRNLTNDRNPESKFHWQIWNPLPGIRNPRRRIQTVLDSLTLSKLKNQTIFFFAYTLAFASSRLARLRFVTSRHA